MKEAHLKESLKSHNLRWTTARQIVFDVLTKSSHALTPKDVYTSISRLQTLKTDQVSVYRNLALFSEIGLAHRMQDGRYSICKHGADDHHDHLHKQEHLHIIVNCLQCGKTNEIEDHEDDLCALATRLSKKMPAFGKFVGLTLQGLCKTCSVKIK